MPAYFITATGTDIGKTFITTLLCQQLKERGRNVFAIKPVISGWTEDVETNDTLRILNSLSLPHTPAHIASVSPWRFIAPLAANLAAKREGKHIIFEEVVDFCRTTLQQHLHTPDDYVLIEGAGGVMSPLTDDKTFLDIIKLLQIPVILVCGSYLGSISHTLTAIETLQKHNIAIQHIVISESEGSNTSLAETKEILSPFIQQPVTYVPRDTTLPDITHITD